MVLALFLGIQKLGASIDSGGISSHSDRPLSNEKSLYVFADTLYWYTSETVDWAIAQRVDQNDQTLTYKTMTFDWDPGFRVGAGYNMVHDGWDTTFYYTWFYTYQRDTFRRETDSITSAFLGSRIALLGNYQSAKIGFKIRLDMFDWEVGRRFLVSKGLSLRPFVGLKGGWIKQTIHSIWEKAPDVFDFALVSRDNLENKFQGVGPKGGVHGKWILGSVDRHQFSLFGDVAGALMWGHWIIKDRLSDNLRTTVSIKIKNRNFGALMFQSLMGLQWDVAFSDCQYHLSTKLGYEIQDWFNQYQVYDNPTGTHNNDLIFQGVTLDLRLDF